MSELPTQRI
jgi:DNA replication protein DnaC